MPLTPELIALGERFLDWPEGGLQFRAPEGPPPGLRLSEDCPSRRIIEYFEGAEQKVTHGTSITGHLFADLFIQSLLPADTMVEMPVPWLPDGLGTSGLDAVVQVGGKLDAHFELKTASKPSPKPTSQNRRQVVRQRAAAYLSGVALPETSVIYIIGKSGHMSCYVYGPFEIIPTEAEWEWAIEEITITRLIVNDLMSDGVHPRDHPLMTGLCNCTWCNPVPVENADDELIKLVDGIYACDIDYYNDMKSWYANIREDVRQTVAPGQSRETPGGWIIKHSEKGVLKIERAKQ